MIRHASPADAPAIVAAYDWLFVPPRVRPPDWSPDVAAERLEAAIADDRSVVSVADENEAIVGFATVYLDIVSVRFGQRAWVEDLAVAPHRRSSGIGKALLDAAKAWARDHGAVWLGLESGGGPGRCPSLL
jgi:GNAT superfamily N-acetyltransferase